MISWNQITLQEFHSLQSHYFNLLAQVEYLNTQIHSIQKQNQLLRKNIQQIDCKTSSIQRLNAQNFLKIQEYQLQLKQIQTKKKTFDSLPSIPQLLLEQKYLVHRKSKNKKRKNNKKQEKKFICPYGECQKLYKSSFSLNLHIKIYHNGGSKRQRQRFASIILQAQERGLQIPEIPITFPEGFLQEFRTNFRYMKKYKM